MKFVFLRLLLVAALAFSGAASADSAVSDVEHLQHGWAHVYYTLPKDQKDAEFDKLEEEARLAMARNPGRAEPLVWCAIIESSHAKFAGGLHALDLIKHARKLLLDAEKIDPQVLGGSIYTSLGSLYAKAPGWPLSFGDKKKAAEYLKQALAINPEGIDPNFFYGQLLIDIGNKETARKFLEKALNAPPREGREDADAGRRAEVQAVLADLD